MNPRYVIRKCATCALCRRKATLRLSHVVSKFLLEDKRYLPSNDPSQGKIWLRNADGSKCQQDGEKYYLLCDTCEQRVGKFEHEFKRRFHSIRPIAFPYQYGPWMHRFCTAQIWRTLHARWLHAQRPDPIVPGGPFHRRAFVDFSVQPSTEELNDSHLIEDLEHAEEAWRQTLLGTACNPGRFRQYLLFPDSRNIRNWLPGVGGRLNYSSDVIAVLVLCYDYLFVGVVRDRRNEMHTKLRNFELCANEGVLRRAGEGKVSRPPGGGWEMDIRNLRRGEPCEE